MFTIGVELIDDPAVDAVVIATRDDTHADLVLAVLHAGKPVMCEKPLAPTADQYREVVAAQVALKNPVDLVTVGFMRRFDPPYVALRDRVLSGGLGAPLMAHCVSRTVHTYPGGDSSSSITQSAIHELDIVSWRWIRPSSR